MSSRQSRVQGRGTGLSGSRCKFTGRKLSGRTAGQGKAGGRRRALGSPTGGQAFPRATLPSLPCREGRLASPCQHPRIKAGVEVPPCAMRQGQRGNEFGQASTPPVTREQPCLVPPVGAGCRGAIPSCPLVSWALSCPFLGPGNHIHHLP